MKKLYKILLVAALLLIIIVLAFRFINTPEYKFVKDNPSSPIDYTNTAYFFTPNALAKSIIEEDNKIVLVDIRSNHDYVNGHLPKAKNIAKTNILDKENYKFFSQLKKNNQTAVLYGQDVEEANIPFMILNQLGIENIRIASKGYQFFQNNDLEKLASSEIDYSTIEVPAADFAKFIADENTKAAERIKLEKEKAKLKRLIPKAKKTVIVKPKQSAPVEEEEEEDEGC